MDIFTNHFLDWLILLALIGAGFYTMKIIGQEKSTFKQESFEVTFGELQLMIPNWWSITEQSENHLRFERTDTRYDWYAIYEYHPDHQNKTLPQLLEEKFNLEGIEFDHKMDFKSDEKMYCTEFIYKVFKRVNKNFEGILLKNYEGEDYLPLENLYLNAKCNIIYKNQF